MTISDISHARLATWGNFTMSNRSEITFLDAIDYCEVHGHDIDFVDMTIADMIGNMKQLEICKRCKKERETFLPNPSNPNLRMSETLYPDGEWH